MKTWDKLLANERARLETLYRINGTYAHWPSVCQQLNWYKMSFAKIVEN